MQILDWIVLGAFVLALVVFIIISMKSKDKTSADYFLAGRDAFVGNAALSFLGGWLLPHHVA